MQFMPSTWATYGVDANGDGIADPNNPEDAIFAAARYLSAAGMPADTYGAIYAYNHADWYVSEVLADAGCYATEVGDAAFTQAGLTPQIEVLRCEPAAEWKQADPGRIPGSLRGRRRPLRTRQARRLGARRDRPPGVELRPRDGRRRSSKNSGRSASKRASGGSTASTATTTATSNTPTSSTRRRRWPARSGRRARSKPASSPTTRPPGTSKRSSPRPKRSKAAARSRYVDWRVAPLAAETTVQGAEAVLQPNGLAAAPAARAARGQGGDRRRQLDRHHPLRLGRRPRLLLLLRLRLLRRGQLRPLRRRAARHAAHLRLAGELRRTRPGQVDHDLRQRHPHLRGDRRAALGHGRRRPRHRPPLARRTALPGRVRGPAPRRVLVCIRCGWGIRFAPGWSRCFASSPASPRSRARRRRRRTTPSGSPTPVTICAPAGIPNEPSITPQLVAGGHLRPALVDPASKVRSTPSRCWMPARSVVATEQNDVYGLDPASWGGQMVTNR